MVEEKSFYESTEFDTGPCGLNLRSRMVMDLNPMNVMSWVQVLLIAAMTNSHLATVTMMTLARTWTMEKSGQEERTSKREYRRSK